ncbi:MBL fold metallo-hydrolase [Streptomyces sp. 8N706]|uniref:MBL fold metallo-hydrolase n=1 Tax=Streptomyces sp. 8N706 TaxID=3457416 RepID=UPI003FD16808
MTTSDPARRSLLRAAAGLSWAVMSAGVGAMSAGGGAGDASATAPTAVPATAPTTGSPRADGRNGAAPHSEPGSAPDPAPELPRTGSTLLLLGTNGGPVPMTGRTGISSVLLVDGRAYMVDFGHGAFVQYARAGLTMADLEAAYVTHLHSDHLADLYSLLWLRFGGYQPLPGPLDIYGPGPAGALPAPHPPWRRVSTVCPENPTPGLSDYLRAQIEATAYDINIRMLNEHWPDIRELLRPHEIRLPDCRAHPRGEMAPRMEPFPVMSDDRTEVTATLVDHPPVFPSFALRFDTAYGSVVFSGDTTSTPNLVTLAQGADVLVHEAIDLQIISAAGLSEQQMRHMRTGHADVTELGRLAQRAGVGTLVLSHLVPGGTDLVPDEVWHRKASQGFDGTVIVGRDLMTIPVRGRRWSRS